MRVIKTGCFGIVVELSGGGGSIESKLKEDGSGANVEAWNTAMDAIESIVLAHACAGIDIEDPRYLQGIETAVLAISERM